MFEPEVFRNQMYCVEESTCDNVLRPHRSDSAPSQSFGAHAVIWRPRNCPPPWPPRYAAAPLIYMYRIDSHSRVEEKVAFVSCRINHLLFQKIWYCQHLLNRVFSMHSISFPLRATKPE